MFWSKADFWDYIICKMPAFKTWRLRAVAGSLMALFAIKSVKTKTNGMTSTDMDSISLFCYKCGSVIGLICNSSVWAAISFVKMLF